MLPKAEKTNELLLENHDLRPCRSQIVPEAQANSSKSRGRSKAHEYKPWHSARMGGERGGHRKGAVGRNYFRRNDDKGKMLANKAEASLGHRCGMSGHWLELVELPHTW